MKSLLVKRPHTPGTGRRSTSTDHLRVALVAFDFPENVLPLATALAATDDVMLVIPKPLAAPLLEELAPDVELVALGKPRLRAAFQQILNTATTVRSIRRFRPDVIHVQKGQFWFNLALPFLPNLPLIVTIHDPRYHLGDRESARTPAWVTRLAYRRADRIVVHGRAIAKQVVETLGVPVDTVDVVPLAGRTAEPAARHDDGRTVLFFGRIWPYKGLEHLIAAEPDIADAFPDVRIIIAGIGEDIGRYRQLMVHPDRFEIRNRFIPWDEARDLFLSATAVVLPYVEATQSGVVPMAFAHECPVVATDVGALTEAVQDGITGLVVPPGDPERLAGAIIRLLRDPDLRARVAKRGRERMENDLSPAAIARDTRAVYARAIERR